MSTDVHAALHAVITARLEVARAATPGPWSRYGNLGYAVFTEAYDDPDYDPPAVTHGSDMEADAEHIALHDPADSIRRYERDLKVLERHYIIWRDISWLERDGTEICEESAELPVCGKCVPKHSSFSSRAEVPEGPCADVLDLLDVYPEVPRDAR